MKEEMARRVKEFVDAQGNRPVLPDISSDPEYLEVNNELNAVPRSLSTANTRTRNRKVTKDKKGTVMHLFLPVPLKQDSSKKGKKGKKGTVMHPVLPVSSQQLQQHSRNTHAHTHKHTHTHTHTHVLIHILSHAFLRAAAGAGGAAAAAVAAAGAGEGLRLRRLLLTISRSVL